MDIEDAEDIIFMYAAINYLENTKKTRKRRYWTRSFLKRRPQEGAYNSLLNDLRIEDRCGLKNFIRMSPESFECLLQKVAPYITKQDTNYRDAINPAEQLAVCLRFLATGDSYTSLMYLHRISKSKLSQCIPEVCEAIIRALKEYCQLPKTEQDWVKLSEQFERKWQYPHCLGSVDGKHIKLVKPEHSGNLYFNYTKTYSIVLLALVDANYNFIYANAGVQGGIPDGEALQHTPLYKAIKDKTLNIPRPRPLAGRNEDTPFVIVADDAFALDDMVMTPYPAYQIESSKERMFNHRLSLARVSCENAFGILASVFRVLLKPIHLCPKKAESVLLACIHLHNFLRGHSEQTYSPKGTFDFVDSNLGTISPGLWRSNQNTSNLIPLQQIPRIASYSSQQISRNEFAEYFMTDSCRVMWQDHYV